MSDVEFPWVQLIQTAEIQKLVSAVENLLINPPGKIWVQLKHALVYCFGNQAKNLAHGLHRKPEVADTCEP